MSHKTIGLFLGIASAVTITLATGFNLLDTFVFPHAYGSLSSGSSSFVFDDTSSTISSSGTSSSSSGSSGTGSSSSSSSGGSSSSSSGSSSSSSVTKTKITYYEDTFTCDSGKSIPYYLADVVLSSTGSLHHHIVTNSGGSFGSGITASLSSQVSTVGQSSVLLAINGDNCISKGKGYSVADGTIAQSKARYSSSSSSVQEDLALFTDGTIMEYSEVDYTMSTISTYNGKSCWQNFAFGPSLIKNGSIAVDEGDEIDGQSMTTNQRTAIGYVEAKHFIFLCTGLLGNRNSGYGYSLYDLACLFKTYDCQYAYNLDGGLVYQSDRKTTDMVYVTE